MKEELTILSSQTTKKSSQSIIIRQRNWFWQTNTGKSTSVLFVCQYGSSQGLYTFWPPFVMNFSNLYNNHSMTFPDITWQFEILHVVSIFPFMDLKSASRRFFRARKFGSFSHNFCEMLEYFRLLWNTWLSMYEKSQW